MLPVCRVFINWINNENSRDSKFLLVLMNHSFQWLTVCPSSERQYVLTPFRETVYLYLLYRQKSIHFQKHLPVKFKASFPTQFPRDYWSKQNKISEIKAPSHKSKAFSRFHTGWPECTRHSRIGKPVEGRDFISSLRILMAMRGKCT